jgi:hypothetical protein
MRIVVGSWFKLQFLGKDAFSSLMRAGVKYKSGSGFMITEETDIKQAVSIIESATSEEVEVFLRCFICGREACAGCPFLENCDRTSVSTNCLCNEHSGPDSFSAYKSLFSSLID